jgi:hypothetical protein
MITIKSGNNATELKGKGGYLDNLVGDLISKANSFLTNPDPSTWSDPTYFNKNGTFQSAVNDAISDEDLSVVSVSVIKGSGNSRFYPVIRDWRGGTTGLAYTNVAFKNFKIDADIGVNNGDLYGDGVWGLSPPTPPPSSATSVTPRWG